MTYSRLSNFLTVSYNKLAELDACDEGLAWFANALGTTGEYSLRDVLEEIHPYEEEIHYVNWYITECNFELPELDALIYDDSRTKALRWYRWFKYWEMFRDLEELI